MVNRHKRRRQHALGSGYYHPAAVIVRLEKARKRGDSARVRVLVALLKKVQSLPPTRQLTKSWRSIPCREMRRRQMTEMRRTMTLQEIGDQYGLSRERVRQILVRAKYEQ